MSDADKDGGQEVAVDQEGQQETKQPEPVFSTDDFFNAVRYGSKSHIDFILQKDSSLHHKFDDQGVTCMHWAAKRGDYDILLQLQEYGAKLDVAASFETRMLPIHWAASDGKNTSLKFLLDFHQDMNVQDANGCSPLIIAVQYGQINSAVYLIKSGADLAVRDNNGDTALHWAAYKGFEEMVGMLMHFVPLQINLEDFYGQTPLHLAALRGNKDVVRYLCVEWGADVGKRDKNGFTPLELAMKKKQIYAEWEIRRFTSSNSLHLAMQLGLHRFKEKKVLFFLLLGYTEKELTAWTWRMAFLSNFIATSVSVWFATSTVLAGFWGLHVLNSIIQTIWWILFITCLLKEPSYVINQAPECEQRLGKNKSKATTGIGSESTAGAGAGAANPHPRSYDAALQIIGDNPLLEPSLLPAVCHTCRLQKPLRSKHDKFTYRCIAKFDHWCPYVFTSVSRDNYKFFCAIIVMHHFAYIFFALTTLCYWWYAPISLWLMIFLVYSTLMFMAISSLGGYHLTLLRRNMTTNEDINAFRYSYFRNEFNLFQNPFDKGSAEQNIQDGLFPSKKLYYTRKEVLQDAARAAQRSRMNSSAGSGSQLQVGTGGEDEEAEGFFEEAKKSSADLV